MTNLGRVIFVCLLATAGCHEPAPESSTQRLEPTTRAGASENEKTLPMTDAAYPWRTDPAFAGRFHPDFPDDLQVIVHEGGPRLTKATPELVWVHVTGKQEEAYEGTLLNQPQQLPKLNIDDSILFLPTNANNPPVMVTEKYLTERKQWHLVPCDKCGMPELFDAPSDLQAKVFPNLPPDSKVETFTSFCPICGGVQVVSSEPTEDQ